ncbi:MAG: hypothetical protein IPL55_14225 [Saprospiraceae bacterium]|nr:hypothetical protein [Saprospiraceae bacterium]MBL0026190.1 hypothetical protein [Saprospiraceae bacterium]
MLLFRNVLVCCIIFAISSLCNGQLNIKVGYTNGFMDAPILNKVVTNFNESFTSKYPGSFLDDNLNKFSSVHGLEIGLRYRVNSVGFELSWNSMSDKSDVYATLPNKVSFQDKWFLSLTEYSAGIENYFGHFGYGASLGYRTARMKTDIFGAPRKKRKVVEESGFASKFYLIFQFGGEKVGIAFKPYVQVPLRNLDISNFDQELNVQGDSAYKAIKPQEERFFLYGISIVLYNGKQ